jgi:hypothetical protein
MNLIIFGTDGILYGQELLHGIKDSDQGMNVDIAWEVDIGQYIAYVGEKFGYYPEVQALVQRALSHGSISPELLEAVSNRIDLSLEDANAMQALT